MFKNMVLKAAFAAGYAHGRIEVPVKRGAAEVAQSYCHGRSEGVKTATTPAPPKAAQVLEVL